MSLADVLQPTAHAEPAADHAIELSADLAMQWACTPALWQPLVRHVDGERWYAPLFDNGQASAWIITWAPGTALELHDHGDATGTFVVLQGALTERYTDRDLDDWDGVFDTLAHRTLGAGSVTSFGPEHIHELRNEASVPVVSLHVYTPSLADMRFYDTDGAATAPAAHGDAPTTVRRSIGNATDTVVPVVNAPAVSSVALADEAAPAPDEHRFERPRSTWLGHLAASIGTAMGGF
jgi:mannose-6-phosphate isomerase-like protein (cupin superfamily)